MHAKCTRVQWGVMKMDEQLLRTVLKAIISAMVKLATGYAKECIDDLEFASKQLYSED